MERESAICFGCKREFASNEITHFCNASFCPDCLELETAVCAECGSREWTGDLEYAGDNGYCSSCAERRLVRCDCCGRWIERENALGSKPYICESCCTVEQYEPAIHEYGYKPMPVFHGEGPRFFGVELEIDGGGESGSNAKALLEIANAEAENLYCKHDGSLACGFELVTHPMSLAYHETVMPWAGLLLAADSMGYTSHDADTCGLHIHISRAAFGGSEAEQDAAIARLLWFFEKNWRELLVFSRRTEEQLEQWAQRYGLTEHPSELLESAKGRGERYAAVNLVNTSTVELRIFRGTLKLKTLIAALQLADSLIDLVCGTSDRSIKSLSWQSFAHSIEKSELKGYLIERGLVSEVTD